MHQNTKDFPECSKENSKDKTTKGGLFWAVYACVGCWQVIQESLSDFLPGSTTRRYILPVQYNWENRLLCTSVTWSTTSSKTAFPPGFFGKGGGGRVLRMKYGAIHSPVLTSHYSVGDFYFVLQQSETVGYHPLWGVTFQRQPRHFTSPFCLWVPSTPIPDQGETTADFVLMCFRSSPRNSVVSMRGRCIGLHIFSEQ